jgi:hypothetical protein
MKSKSIYPVLAVLDLYKHNKQQNRILIDNKKTRNRVGFKINTSLIERIAELNSILQQ